MASQAAHPLYHSGTSVLHQSCYSLVSIHINIDSQILNLAERVHTSSLDSLEPLVAKYNEHQRAQTKYEKDVPLKGHLKSDFCKYQCAQALNLVQTTLTNGQQPISIDCLDEKRSADFKCFGEELKELTEDDFNLKQEISYCVTIRGNEKRHFFAIRDQSSANAKPHYILYQVDSNSSQWDFISAINTGALIDKTGQVATTIFKKIIATAKPALLKQCQGWQWKQLPHLSHKA